MADRRSGLDVVSEFLAQNPHLAQWVESLRGECETNKQWNARKEFILRNMESFPTIEPGVSSSSLDRLLSLSMVWANHTFMGCTYPQPVMDKVREMAEGVVVPDAPIWKTREETPGGGKRPGGEAETCVKKLKPGGRKPGPSPKAPAEHQPFFNRLYKAVAWKLVSAGPNLDHFELLQACAEASKASLSSVVVPLRDIPDLPAARAQRDGQVCELRCQTVYLGTGYGRDELAAKAMASKEALKVFQGRRVAVRICRRRFRGHDVDDLVLLDEQPRGGLAFPPALSYPFQDEQPDGRAST